MGRNCLPNRLRPGSLRSAEYDRFLLAISTGRVLPAKTSGRFGRDLRPSSNDGLDGASRALSARGLRRLRPIQNRNVVRRTAQLRLNTVRIPFVSGSPALDTASLIKNDQYEQMSTERLEQDESAPYNDATRNNELKRVLGIRYAVMVILGHAIGAGIFVKPGNIAADAGSFPVILGAWTIGALLCLSGAFCFAELSSRLPFSGGIYVYLRESYGPLPAFLFGWQSAFFSRPASSAALSTVAVGSLSYSIGWQLQSWQVAGLSTVLIAVFAAMNTLGVLWGARMQAIAACVKCCMLLAVVISPFAYNLIGMHELNLSLLTETVDFAGKSWPSRMMTALVSVMWAFSGWEAIVPISEEVKNPERNLPRALLAGGACLAALYILAVVAYHLAIPIGSMATTENRGHVAEILLKKFYGPLGGYLISIGIALASIGTVSSNILTAPRVSFAMARDKLLPASLASIHPNYRTPYVAIMTHAVIAIMLIVIATALTNTIAYFRQRTPFDLLSDCIVFQAGVFYTAGVASLFVLRRRKAGVKRFFKVPLYPWLPISYVIAYTVFVIAMFNSRLYESLFGVLLLAFGGIVYLTNTVRRTN